MSKGLVTFFKVSAISLAVIGVGAVAYGYATGKDMNKIVDLVNDKVSSIITPKAPIGNITPARDLSGTWVSSLKNKGIQTYSKFEVSGAVTTVYQEGDVILVIDSVKDNIAYGNMTINNLCTWGQTVAPKIPVISIPKQCVSLAASPSQIRVTGSALDFGSVTVDGSVINMQGSFTTDLISGTLTATSPYGVIKGEFHLMRSKE